MKKLGKKKITIEVPEDLYIMYSKLCMDRGITRTDAFIMYLEYLQKQYYKSRRVLNEDSTPNFELDERQPR